jgi:hypothetical protein
MEKMRGSQKVTDRATFQRATPLTTAVLFDPALESQAAGLIPPHAGAALVAFRYSKLQLPPARRGLAGRRIQPPVRHNAGNPAREDMYQAILGESSVDYEVILDFLCLFAMMIAIGFMLMVVKMALMLV